MGAVGFGFDLSPQIADIDPQQMRLFRIRGPPHLPQDLVMSQHFAGMSDQQPQKIILGWRELYLIPLNEYPAMFQVHFQAIHPVNGLRRLRKEALLRFSLLGKLNPMTILLRTIRSTRRASPDGRKLQGAVRKNRHPLACSPILQFSQDVLPCVPDDDVSGIPRVEIRR